MKAKRWSVWLAAMLVALGLSELRAQEVDTLLIDDTQPAIRAVKRHPLVVPLPVPSISRTDRAAPVPAPATSALRQVVLKAHVVELNLDQLPAVKGEKSLRDRLEAVAKKVGWVEQHRGVDWKSKSGLDLKAAGLQIEMVGKSISEPTLAVLSGHEATLLIGGELPIQSADDSQQVFGWRPFGLSMKCVPTVWRDGRVRLNLTLENSNVVAANRQTDWLEAIKQLVLTKREEQESNAPVVVGQSVSFHSDFSPGESLILTLPHSSNAANKITLFCVTPELLPVSDANFVVAQADRGAPTPLAGQGVNSDANVTGRIVLEDKAAGTRLEADSVTIDVPKVINLGVEMGRAGALVVVDHPDAIRARLVATSIVLDDVKGPRKADDEGLFSATVALKSMSKTALDAIQNLKLDDKQKLFLVPLPEGLRALERAQVQRLFEHAYIRAVTSTGLSDELVFVAEVAPGQKTVRVPVKHAVYLLLQTPMAAGRVEGFEYLSMTSSGDSGLKRVGNLTVIFVSENLFQLESLIEELEPTAKIAAIEVRDAVVLRGTVTSPEQRKSLVEVAEQFYPKVLDQMRQQTGQPNAEASFIDLESSKTAARPKPTIQRVAGQEPSIEKSVTLPKDVPLQSERRQSIPGELPSLDELKELRDEVKGLRQDVQRLSNLMERDRKTSAKASTPVSPDPFAPVITPETPKTANPLVPMKPQAEAIADIDPKEVEERAWQLLGVRLAPLTDEQRKRLVGTQYQGGMLVTAVRNSSTAELNGFRTDDILVGLHNWETLSLRNVAYVLSQSDQKKISPLKFYVVRDGQTVWGHVLIKLAAEASTPKTLSPLVPRKPPTEVIADIDLKKVEERAWQMLGVRLAPLTDEDLDLLQPQYRGGMMVTEVCHDSSAEVYTRLRAGDILHSLHGWGPMGLRNVDYLLNHPDPKKLSHLKFIALRHGQSVHGSLPTNWAAEVSAMKAISVKNAASDAFADTATLDGTDTSKAREKGRLVVAAYSVADLVIPVAGAKLDQDEFQPDGQFDAASQALMDLLTSTIEPNSWSNVGGHGSIKFNALTMSLVIRTTPDVHQQIADLFSQLRRLQDTQITLEMAVISAQADQIPSEIGDASDASSLVLAPSSKRSLIEKWQGDRRSNILQVPKVTLFNGQTATLNSSELGTEKLPVNLVLSGVVSADRKSVRLSLGINGTSFETAARHQQQTLPEGQSVMIDITDDISSPAQLLKKLPVAFDSDEARNILKNLKPTTGQRILLLVTPRVIVIEEEEVRPAVPQPVFRTHRGEI